jgi:hypothetical protein
MKYGCFLIQARVPAMAVLLQVKVKVKYSRYRPEPDLGDPEG